MKNTFFTLGFFGLALLGLCGCASSTREPAPSAKADATITAPPTAVAELNPTQGNTAKGRVTFTKVTSGIRVVAEITGLTPGKHGFHIHEKGDCSAPDGASAGGHFNPYGTAHGDRDADTRHVGDFGNITADAKGVAKVDFVDPRVSFEGLSSIIGKAVIVHAQADDGKTQPTGNAGGRVACGVIEKR